MLLLLQRRKNQTRQSFRDRSTYVSPVFHRIQGPLMSRCAGLLHPTGRRPSHNSMTSRSTSNERIWHLCLDVPKDAKVVDTRSGEELKTLLAAYSKQQNSAFDNYTATVLKTIDDWRSINEAFLVRLTAAGHSAEVVDSEQLLKFQMDRVTP